MKNFLFLIVITLFTATSCRKVFDFIHDHPDAHVSFCRIDTIKVKHYNPFDDVLTVTYNKKGNPVTLLSHSKYSNGGQYFRYDLLNRLTDYIQTDIWDTGQATYSVLLWHKYGYPRPGFVTDTSFINFGDAAKPAPNAADDPSGYFIVGYTFDAQGRIDRYWGVSKDPHQPPQPGYKVIYDANGNQPPTNAKTYYDDKINAYRTNKIWQFVYHNYSRNNELPLSPDPGVIILPSPVYNDLGLPLQLPNSFERNIQLFGLINTGPTFDITYACSMPKGPIDY
jgi:hypothetical protein